MSARRWHGWAALLLPAAAGYAFHVVAHLWGRPFAFQDDMRQHVLGLAPTADLFGAYYAATVPPGIAALHRLTSGLCAPLDWARWVQPLLIAVWLAWGARRLAGALGHAGRGWVFAAWVQVFAWSGDDLVSSTPRAWAMAFLVEILGSVAARQPARLAMGAAIASLCYPPVAVLGWASGAALAGWLWIRWLARPPALRETPGGPTAPSGPDPALRELMVWSLSLVVAAGAIFGVARLLDGRLRPFGPKITRSEAVRADEFRGSGRAAFFSDNPIAYWVTNSRGGLVNRDSEVPWWVVIAFGVMAIVRRPPAMAAVLPGLWRGPAVPFLIAWLGTSLLLFFSAHAFWLHLFHPSRYVQFSVTLLAALLLAAAVSGWRRLWQAGAMAALFALSAYLGNAGFQDGRVAGALQYVIRSPRTAVVAAHPESPLAATVPLLLGARSVASVELALPYHLGFYGTAAGRIRDAFTAWYTDDPGMVQAFQDKYAVTHWILEGTAWAGRDAGFPLHPPWRKLVPKRMAEIPKPVLARVHDGRAAGGPVVLSAAEMTQLLQSWPRPAPRLQVPNLRIQVEP